MGKGHCTSCVELLFSTFTSHLEDLSAEVTALYVPSRHPPKDLLLLRIMARRLQTHETARHPVSRGHSRFGTLARLVSQRGIVGLGRSDGRRRKRQTRLGSVHQTFSSSKRHGNLLVSRYVSRRIWKLNPLLLQAM